MTWGEVEGTPFSLERIKTPGYEVNLLFLIHLFMVRFKKFHHERILD